jgi:hypothetical protein
LDGQRLYLVVHEQIDQLLQHCSCRIRRRRSSGGPPRHVLFRPRLRHKLGRRVQLQPRQGQLLRFQRTRQYELLRLAVGSSASSASPRHIIVRTGSSRSRPLHLR